MSNSDWIEGFVERLTVLQERFGHSKAEMARRCGLPPRTLENYFKGHKPGVEALIAISRGMDVDIDWLIGEATEAKSFNVDMVGEATHRVLVPFLEALVHRVDEGATPIRDGKIFGKNPLAIASELEWRIRDEYAQLRTDYAQPTLREAQTRSRTRDAALRRTSEG
ncbi:MAG: helix-turn-helix transcriptional regulator [Rhodobacteraceae bacterium]|nr:helix-turn-helix transcriptional regulator [Paracoccaceae bacterium]